MVTDSRGSARITLIHGTRIYADRWIPFLFTGRGSALITTDLSFCSQNADSRRSVRISLIHGDSRPQGSRKCKQPHGMRCAKTTRLSGPRRRTRLNPHGAILALRTMLVSRPSGSRHNSRAGHPGWLRCSFLKYSRYSRSSRLASRAPRSGTYATIHRDWTLGWRRCGCQRADRSGRPIRAG